jgi:hypothetical protein
MQNNDDDYNIKSQPCGGSASLQRLGQS